MATVGPLANLNGSARVITAHASRPCSHGSRPNAPVPFAHGVSCASPTMALRLRVTRPDHIASTHPTQTATAATFSTLAYRNQYRHTTTLPTPCTAAGQQSHKLPEQAAVSSNFARPFAILSPYTMPQWVYLAVHVSTSSYLLLWPLTRNDYDSELPVDLEFDTE